MKSFFIQKNSFLLLLGVIVIVSASLVYLLTAGNALMSRKIVIEAFMYVLRTRFSKQTFTPNTSISLEFAATEFHPHSATSSASPTIGPATYLPINTPVVAMQNEQSYGRSISTEQVKE